MSVTCFYLEPTKTRRRWLRRYTMSHTSRDYSCAGGWHQAMVQIEDGVDVRNAEGYSQNEPTPDPATELRWPKTCEKCAYKFLPEDAWQLFHRTVYRRADTGEEMILEDAPPGAMWNAWWRAPLENPTADGMVLEVKCPDGDTWCIDSRASNCTMRQDRVHHCWVRHGTPPLITVDKAGPTCHAGAGSIWTHSGWHGFLTNGVFRKC